MSQITATATFPPLQEASCSFDLLIYTDEDLVPEKWGESGPQFLTVLKKPFSINLLQLSTKYIVCWPTKFLSMTDEEMRTIM